MPKSRVLKKPRKCPRDPRVKIDFVIAGLGKNEPHIAFDPPGSSWNPHVAPVKIIKPSEEARAQQVNPKHPRLLPSLDSVPNRVVTLSVPALMAAKYLFLIAPGKHKVKSVNEMMGGRPGPRSPASAVRLHKNGIVFLTKESAAGLDQKRMVQQRGYKKYTLDPGEPADVRVYPSKRAMYDAAQEEYVAILQRIAKRKKGGIKHIFASSTSPIPFYRRIRGDPRVLELRHRLIFGHMDEHLGLDPKFKAASFVSFLRDELVRPIGPDTFVFFDPSSKRNYREMAERYTRFLRRRYSWHYPLES